MEPRQEGPSLIAAGVMRELLTAAPRPLVDIEAELLILAGQYLLHWREGKQDRFKFLSADSLSAAFSQEPVDTGWLPSGICRWGAGPDGTWLIMFIAPARHTLQISLTDNDAPTPLMVPLPGLVFTGIQTSYYIWAVKGMTFNSAANLYHAPLPNVHPDGRICFGPTNPPPTAAANTMETAWQLFLTSPFNNHLVSGKSRRQPDDVRRHLQALAEQHRRQYPVRDLVLAAPPHVTIASVVERNFVNWPLRQTGEGM
jgi:PRTRC genetic system protein B